MATLIKEINYLLSEIAEARIERRRVIRNGKKKVIKRKVHKLKPKKGYRRIFLGNREIYKKETQQTQRKRAVALKKSARQASTKLKRKRSMKKR